MKITFLFIIFLTVVVNVLVPIFISRYIIKTFKKLKSADRTLYKMKILQQYMQFFIIIVSMFVFTFSLSQLLVKNEMNRVILLMSPFLFLLAVVILNQIIYHKVYRIVREVEITVKEEIIEGSKNLLLMVFPSIVVLLVNVEVLKKIELGQVFEDFAIIALIVVINLLYPYIVRIFFHATPIKSKDLEESLLKLLEKHSLKKVKIYQWPSSKNKIANAIVCGLIEKKIFISDYLIDNLSVEEIEAILAHEIGHLKKFHLWIKVALMVFAIPLFTTIGYIMDEFENIFGLKIPIPLGIAIFFVAMILYFGFVYMFFSRIQERQADEYAVKSGIDVNVYISALIKLAKLNNSVEKFNEVDEKFQTHPSFEKRIKWLKNTYSH